jgi:hypothetical protein
MINIPGEVRGRRRADVSKNLQRLSRNDRRIHLSFGSFLFPAGYLCADSTLWWTVPLSTLHLSFVLQIDSSMTDTSSGRMGIIIFSIGYGRRVNNLPFPIMWATTSLGTIILVISGNAISFRRIWSCNACNYKEAGSRE